METEWQQLLLLGFFSKALAVQSIGDDLSPILMSMAAQNIASEYYRSVSLSYAQAANFQKTKETIKQTREAVAPTKPTKVVLAQAIRESQKTPSEPLRVASDIRRFAVQSRSEAPSESQSEGLNRADAQAEKAAEAMARNARKAKPVFQSDRKTVSLLA